MSELQSDQYSALVKQVYIDPIRTVVIVDDDFPILDDLLKSAAIAMQSDVDAATAQPRLKQKINMQFNGQIAEVQRVQEMIQHCREHSPPWLVDVHNGSLTSGFDEVQLAPWLHQSDLMILDYHLDGDSGNGIRALEILKKLAANDQFNLVVVYTKGISGGIYEVYEQIAMALAYRDWSEPLPMSKREAIRSLIMDWEGEAEDLEVENQLLNYISTKIYFRYRSGLLKFKGSDLESPIKNFLLTCPEKIRNRYIPIKTNGTGEEKIKLTSALLFEYTISLKHQELCNSDLLSSENYGCIACDFEADFNWLRLDKIFITVVDKSKVAPTSLEAHLLTALGKWAPGPHQLLMAKMRTQLGEKGVNAESIVLANRPLQAGWLSEFLNGGTDAERITTQSINRHWEALGDVIYHDVKHFAKEVFDHFNEDKDLVRERYMPSGYTSDQQVAHLNYYYSAKSIDSQHLMTGQIFELEEPDVPGKKFFWICLSPACDLVPENKKASGWKGRLGNTMPFLAVKLQEAKISDALKDINHNRFLFIQAGEEINAFQFTESQGSLPIWEQMFAGNSGKFAVHNENKRRMLTIQRMLVENGNLAFKPYDAKIVCQLRYEYALNLLQRLGHALTRVGLDFKSSAPVPNSR